MFNLKNIYTAESVTSGHPDKVCDQISDAILDEYLKQDPTSRVAIESFGSHGLIVVGGEVTSKGRVELAKVAKNVYQESGYIEPINTLVNVVEQSPDIAQGVDIGGAGDQGIMYGFATNETKEFLPLGVVLAHKLAQGLEFLRQSKQIEWLLPDGKTQVTIEKGKVKTVLVSCQHQENVSYEEIKAVLKEKLIQPVLGELNFEVLVNPTGKFVLGGFTADTGLTGRKIMVDTYCGLAPHGGGCFSGKDPSKVDRSAAYMARFVAKNLVAHNLAKECLVSVAYAIGRANPLMIGAINEKGEDLSPFIKERFDFRPKAIIERLNLQKPIYRQTAVYGHFSNPNFPWEQIEKSL
ncbi:MAG: methionine adenosyltransferase [bacterium]|nr:methionine adenosyltransferase [bacterium]